MDRAADVQAGAFRFELVGDGAQIDGGATQPVEFRDDERVAGPAGSEGFPETGSFSVASGIALVGVDPVVGDAEPFEGCALRSQILAAVEHRA